MNECSPCGPNGPRSHCHSVANDLDSTVLVSLFEAPAYYPPNALKVDNKNNTIRPTVKSRPKRVAL